MSEQTIWCLVVYVFIGLTLFFATIMRMPDTTKMGWISTLMALFVCIVSWPALILAALLAGGEKK